MLDLRSLLGVPAAYRLFIRLIGANYRDRYLQEYVQPRAGQRVFDIGCGPGDVLADFPDVEYVGIDINRKYIAAAQRRFGSRGVFRCEGLADAVVREPGSYDIVMANGVLHHLGDDEARHLLKLAGQALKPTGRLVTHDPCYVPNQSLAVRALLAMDRGRFVRTPNAYTALAAEAFAGVRSQVCHDWLRVPYTAHIMVCTGSRQGELLLRPAA